MAKERKLLLILLKYLVNEFGDGETPLRKMAKTIKKKRKAKPVNKDTNYYDRLMKGRLTFTSPNNLSKFPTTRNPVNYG